MRTLAHHQQVAEEPLPGERVAEIQQRDPWLGVKPIVYYLFIEYTRPMVWILPFLKVVRPGMLAVFWGFGTYLMSNTKRALPKHMKWIFAFIGLMIFQIFVATNNRAALEKLQIDMLPMVLGCALPLATLPNSVRAMKIVLTAFFAVHIPTAIHGIQSGGYGPGGWFGDQNDLAFALNCAVGVGTYLFVESYEIKRKIWIAAGLGILVTAVIVSFSRGGLLGLATVGAYLFISAKRSRGPILALCLISIVAILIFAPAEWKEEMGTIDEASSAQDTGGKRLYYWEIGWKMFLDHPITGVGTENYGIRAPEYRDLSRFKESMWKRVAHSLYFTLIPEHGLVGCYIYGGMILICFRGNRRLQRRFAEAPDHPTRRTAAMLSSGLSAGLVASLVTGTFVSVLYYPPVWILVAMMGSLTDLADEEDEAERLDAGEEEPA